MTEQAGTFPGATVAEAAAILGVSPTTIRRMVKRGQLEGRRVLRPQGSAFVVMLPARPGDAADDAPPTQHPGRVPPRSNAPPDASPAGQLAAWSETFLLPLVAALERQAARVAELEREAGRLAAELAAERETTSTLLASTASQASAAPSGPALARWRLWATWLLTVLALVAAIALLAWPR